MMNCTSKALFQSNHLATSLSGAGRCWSLMLLFVSSWLAGCASTGNNLSHWPTDIPDRSHYVALYQADGENAELQSDDEYLKWVVRFYRGWALSPYSWDWLTEKALEESEAATTRL